MKWKIPAGTVCADCGKKRDEEDLGWSLGRCETCYQALQFQLRKVYTCVDCGAPVDKRRIRCRACYMARITRYPIGFKCTICRRPRRKPKRGKPDRYIRGLCRKCYAKHITRSVPQGDEKKRRGIAYREMVRSKIEINRNLEDFMIGLIDLKRKAIE